jgi:hypothetical protein
MRSCRDRGFNGDDRAIDRADEDELGRARLTRAAVAEREVVGAQPVRWQCEIAVGARAQAAGREDLHEARGGDVNRLCSPRQSVVPISADAGRATVAGTPATTMKDAENRAREWSQCRRVATRGDARFMVALPEWFRGNASQKSVPSAPHGRGQWAVPGCRPR